MRLSVTVAESTNPTNGNNVPFSLNEIRGLGDNLPTDLGCIVRSRGYPTWLGTPPTVLNNHFWNRARSNARWNRPVSEKWKTFVNPIAQLPVNMLSLKTPACATQNRALRLNFRDQPRQLALSYIKHVSPIENGRAPRLVKVSPTAQFAPNVTLPVSPNHVPQPFWSYGQAMNQGDASGIGMRDSSTETICYRCKGKTGIIIRGILR
ncbi:MAG: hypothetical protein CMM01_24830 [Rhodopirellula sp.]|nr:hypothetical protein [Rhodopirellula sp.]